MFPVLIQVLSCGRKSDAGSSGTAGSKAAGGSVRPTRVSAQPR